MTLPHYALRQTIASLFAYALVELFPSAQLMDCDVDQIGFTYTFSLDQPLEDGILTLVEEKMRALAKSDLPVQPVEMMRENAVQLFKHVKQRYKAELVGSSLVNIVPILKIGDAFYDYAETPYLESTGELIAFKLQKLEKINKEESIFQVTGTAFPDPKSLRKFLKNYEDAKKRDHRLLGKEMGLFSQMDGDEWFWLPKGSCLRETLLGLWREGLLAQQFQLVSSPRLIRTSTLRRAGAIDRDRPGEVALENGFSLPSSLTPLHALLFRAANYSVRDLPVRYMEAAPLYKNISGSAYGLFNSSSFTAECAHTFCSSSQVSETLISSLQFIEKTVNILGFECQWNLFLRGPKFAGTKEKWDKALGWMTDALQSCGCEYVTDSSGSAFDGPRMVVRMKDALGREWEGPFIGIDFNHSEAYGLRYQGSDGEMHIPYMITQSLFGSLERFIAVLVEHYGGAFPLWLAPEQVRLLPIADAHQSYADEICKKLSAQGIRCSVDYRQEPLGTKVHAAEREKVPYAVIVGDAEKKDGVVNVRACSQHGQAKRMELVPFLQKMQEETAFPGPAN